MKKLKKTLALVMALITVIATFSCLAVTAGAATKTIKNDTYVSVPAAETYYKVTVSGEGYITVSAIASASGEYSDASATFEILNSKKKNFCKDDYFSASTYSSYSKPKGSIIIPVSKGTYYIHTRGANLYKTASVKLKYKYTSMKTATNYSLGKAITVSAGKTQKVFQTPQNNFNRWYKITLTKSQKVTITSNGYGYFYLYDANGETVDLDYDYDTEKYISSLKLVKGTYYLLKTTYSNKPGSAAYATFSWK